MTPALFSIKTLLPIAPVNGASQAAVSVQMPLSLGLR